MDYISATRGALLHDYFTDEDYRNTKGFKKYSMHPVIALNNAIREEIKNKDTNLKGQMVTQGTTPRRYTDLIGSLCDLTSGSGDKGTPIVLVQGYFDNFSNE